MVDLNYSASLGREAHTRGSPRSRPRQASDRSASLQGELRSTMEQIGAVKAAEAQRKGAVVRQRERRAKQDAHLGHDRVVTDWNRLADGSKGSAVRPWRPSSAAPGAFRVEPPLSANSGPQQPRVIFRAPDPTRPIPGPRRRRAKAEANPKLKARDPKTQKLFTATGYPGAPFVAGPGRRKPTMAELGHRGRQAYQVRPSWQAVDRLPRPLAGSHTPGAPPLGDGFVGGVFSFKHQATAKRDSASRDRQIRSAAVGSVARKAALMQSGTRFFHERGIAMPSKKFPGDISGLAFDKERVFDRFAHLVPKQRALYPAPQKGDLFDKVIALHPLCTGTAYLDYKKRVEVTMSDRADPKRVRDAPPGSKADRTGEGFHVAVRGDNGTGRPFFGRTEVVMAGTDTPIEPPPKLVGARNSGVVGRAAYWDRESATWPEATRTGCESMAKRDLTVTMGTLDFAGKTEALDVAGMLTGRSVGSQMLERSSREFPQRPQSAK